jgi:hypothetical protein
MSALFADAAARACKRIHCLLPEHLAPYKDINEYWVAKRDLPQALHRGLRAQSGAPEEPAPKSLAEFA